MGCKAARLHSMELQPPPCPLNVLSETPLPDDLNWVPFRPGMHACWLYRVPNGPSAALLKYEERALGPKHRHTGYEHVLCILGLQCDERGDLPKGSLVINPPGSDHCCLSSPTGCVVLAIYEKPVDFSPWENGDGSDVLPNEPSFPQPITIPSKWITFDKYVHPKFELFNLAEDDVMPWTSLSSGLSVTSLYGTESTTLSDMPSPAAFLARIEPTCVFTILNGIGYLHILCLQGELSVDGTSLGKGALYWRAPAGEVSQTMISSLPSEEAVDYALVLILLQQTSTTVLEGSRAP
mmetsp:Transcript_37051/g.60009  ORF Transcript_37051/g.60009 Transcript_37051/m.60009 type:complete len:294 (-) Transcript_37051:131-1012(-)